MSLHVAGTDGPIEMPVRSIWSRTGGASLVRRWWGPSAVIRNLYDGFVGASNVAEVTYDQAEGSPVGIVSVNYTEDVTNPGEDAVEQVEIAFSDQQFPLHQNPTFANIPTATIRSMEPKLANHEPNPNTAGTPEHKYYELRTLGVDNYRVKLPAVTWTRIVPEGWIDPADIANVGSIFSTAAIAADLAAPVLFTIPTGNVGVVTDSLGLFTVGWMKDAQVSYQSDGRVQIVLRAEYGCWANSLYTFV